MKIWGAPLVSQDRRRISLYLDFNFVGGCVTSCLKSQLLTVPDENEILMPAPEAGTRLKIILTDSPLEALYAVCAPDLLTIMNLVLQDPFSIFVLLVQFCTLFCSRSAPWSCSLLLVIRRS